MDRALKLMEFKAKIEELKPQALTFLVKMDELFSRLNNKIKYITNAIAEDNIVDINNIKSRIESEFSGPNMLSEITVIFRNPGEYFTLRDAAAKLKEALGDNLIISAESAIRPYLKQKLNNAFEQTPARK